MGNSISEQLKEQQKKNDKEAVQELQMLQELMANKVAAASAKMREEALRDTHLPIVAFVDTSEKYSVNVSNVPDDKITESIKDMFGGDFVGGLIGLIGVALNQFLGNTQAGASEQFDYHIIFSNNSLMRVDFMFYKYEFSSKGIEDKHQSGFCYSTQAAVLDLKKVSPEVLLYALTRSVGQSNVSDAVKRLHALAEFGEELYQVINKLNEEPKKSITESDDDPDHREEQIRQPSDEV